MKKTRKSILTCAVTGSIHTPTMSPHLPITPQQIADEAIAAAEAGAAVVHLHARDPQTGRPTPDPATFMEFLPVIKQRTDVVVNISTGGASGMSLDERLAAARTAKPELASLNMGTLNFGAFQAAERIQEWKHDWEKPFLESTKRVAMANSFEDIERVATELYGEYGTRFEFECYDVGHLYTLKYFADKGIVKPPFMIQCIVGVLGGIGAEPRNLMHMVQVADGLFGDDWHLSVLGVGRHQMEMGTLSAILGGHIRVGLEDSLLIARGELARSNADQVSKIRRILKELGRDIATPGEAREMLGLKGGDKVGF